MKLYCLLFAASLSVVLPLGAETTPVISKWSRFEKSFKSLVTYADPLREATFTVLFTAPDGRTIHAYGFWDGGKTWRVRFSPDQVGHWSYETTCSDPSNKGLHRQTGKFICSIQNGKSRFAKHGPVRVALDHRHFEHADGTPFFWMADNLAAGMPRSTPADLELYAKIRVGQGFTAAVWPLGTSTDEKGELPCIGGDRVTINPAFFQRLDAKVAILEQAGLLNMITPLDGYEYPDAPLPEDDAALLVRYVVARWGASVAGWVLPIEGEGEYPQVNRCERWKKLAPAAFLDSHGPIVVYASETTWLLNRFRGERWVDAVGYGTLRDSSDDSLRWLTTQTPAVEWSKEPPGVVLPFLPSENRRIGRTETRFQADDVRRAAWWTLLLVPPAGFCYSAEGVAAWGASGNAADRVVRRDGSQASGFSSPGKPEDYPLWHRSLFLPGAKQMSHLGQFMTSFEFWRVRPAPNFLPAQPGVAAPGHFVVSAGNDTRTLGLLYDPIDRTIEIFQNALPPAPNISWLNPRTGETTPAVAVIAQHCQLPTPAEGDWVLVMRSGK
jgi:hypothetical protein